MMPAPIKKSPTRRIGARLVFLTVLIIASLPWVAAASDTGGDIYYYARLDVATTDGVITETRLSMAPSAETFRTEKFIPIRVMGECETGGRTDIMDCAKHNALSGLLLKSGLKSLKSARNSKNTAVHDEVRMRYEGMVKHPFHILSNEYGQDGKTFSVEMDIWFSPIAFPDKWSMLYLRNVFIRFFQDLYDALT